MTSIFMVIGIVGWIALLTSIYVYKKAKDERLKSITIDDKESTDPNVVVIGGGTRQSVFLRLQLLLLQMMVEDLVYLGKTWVCYLLEI